MISDEEYARLAHLVKAMNHRERLSSMEALYLLGCGDYEQFDLNDTLFGYVSRTPLYSYQAGRDWPDSLFQLYADDLVRTVASHNSFSEEAVVSWPLQRLEGDHGARIVEQLFPESCYFLGIRFEDDRFSLLGAQLSGRVSERHDYAHRAIQEWPLERVQKHGAILSQHIGTLQGTKPVGMQEFQAIGKLPLERFLAVADTVSKHVSSPHLTRLDKWPREYFRYALKTHLGSFERANTLVTQFEQMSVSEKYTWFYLADKIGIETMSRPSLPDLKLCFLAFSHTHEKNSKNKFQVGLKENILRGTQRKYCRAIIDYFRKDTTGGAHYRALEAAV